MVKGFKKLTFLAALGTALFGSGPFIWGTTVDLYQDNVSDGQSVNIINENFKRLNQLIAKLQEQVDGIDVSTATGNSVVSGVKNKIINGAMTINQRSGHSNTVSINSTAGSFGPDRWKGLGQAADGVYTLQSNTTNAPTQLGFSHVLIASVTTADASLAAGQHYTIRYAVEGLDLADYALGTSSAATFTLSFLVRCSTTGTFGGSFQNSAANRSYPFTFTIDSANAWESKSITVTGDTSGTWLTTNGIGMVLSLSLGAGSSMIGTANSWAAADYRGATGQKNLISISSASISITGVQIEAGLTATAFERRVFAYEVAAAQRYFEKSYALDTSVATLTNTGGFRILTNTVNDWQFTCEFKVQKRTSPTMTFYNPNSGATGSWRDITAGADKGITSTDASDYKFTWQNSAGFTVSNVVVGHWTADAEL